MDDFTRIDDILYCALGPRMILCGECEGLYAELIRHVPLEDLKGHYDPTYSWFLSSEFKKKSDLDTVRTIAANIELKLSEVFHEPCQVYEALVHNGETATAHFLMDMPVAQTPSSVMLLTAFDGLGGEIGSWRFRLCGSDPLRRRLLFFKGRLDPRRWNLEYRVNGFIE